MLEACPRCGWIIEYGCGCPNGSSVFPTVPYREPRVVEVPSYQATIFIAGDLEKARAGCRMYCDEIGECVTVTPTEYVYTRGEETGVAIGFINYGRFPRSRDVIFARACNLARRLLIILGQDSASVVATDRTIWLSCREPDPAPTGGSAPPTASPNSP